MAVLGQLDTCLGTPGGAQFANVYVVAVRSPPKSDNETLLASVAKVMDNNQGTKVSRDGSFHLSLMGGPYAIVALPWTRSSGGIGILVEPENGWRPFNVSIKSTSRFQRIKIPAICSSS